MRQILPKLSRGSGSRIFASSSKINFQQDWHAQEPDVVLKHLYSNDSKGLTNKDAKVRCRFYGQNQLVVTKPQNILIRFLRQFNNILIYILLVSTVIALVLQHWVDAAVILCVIVLNAIVGFIQEGKAQKALAAIRDLLAPVARVLRDGNRITIAAKLLVPGDIVILERGDKIPADLRLLQTRGLQIQESILTGESQAVEKTTTAISKEAPLGERTSMAYSGTLVANGSGIGVVVATGTYTEVGHISTILSNVEAPTTPLLERMNRFGYSLTLGILLLATITFLVGDLVWKHPGQSLFMAIVGLIVAAVPEGLPPILTIILAIGVTKMARHRAIVRSLPAVETMGAVTVICADKTGTLTLNHLSVEDVVTAKHRYDITGNDICIITPAKALQRALKSKDASGEQPSISEPPHCVLDAAALIEHNDLRTALEAGVLCNDAELNYIEGNQTLYGDPLDQALLLLAKKAKIDLHLMRQTRPRSDLIPYESEHKYMATLHHDHKQGKTFIFIKGAPEHTLAYCVAQQIDGKSEKIDPAYWHQEINTLAAKGEKVLAVAYKEITGHKQQLLFSDIKDLTMVGLFGFIDPPRSEAAAAVEECHRAGIRVKMLTGDYPITAQAIAKMLGIGYKAGGNGKVLTGTEIERMDDAELAKEVCAIDIYARTMPEHKLRLVKALQTAKQIVAMTGDGVNDAPALHQADIGIAMGGKGTEIAKEASDVILTDDNFATIVQAIREGRSIYQKLKTTILYILPTSAAQAFIVVVAVMLGWVSPITPVQILWVNMVTAITLALALGFEEPAFNVMKTPPHPKSEPILSKFLVWRVAFVSILLVVAVFATSAIERFWGADVHTMQTAAVNMIVLGEIVYLFNCRNIYEPVLNWAGLFGSLPILLAVGAVLMLQLAFTYIPIMQNFFGTHAMDLRQWGWIVGIAILVFFAIELEKRVMRFFEQQKIV